MKNNNDLRGAQKEYEAQEFKGISISDGSLDRKVFASCIFIKCSFREVRFDHCKFEDCTFRNCDLSLAVLKECTFKDTAFEDSQLIGINWTDTNLAQRKAGLAKPVRFTGCVLNHSTFIGLNLKDLVMSKCVARGVSFEEADLTGANCTHTDFADSRFLHTDLTEADFSGATNYSIAAGFNTLKKTKFSLPEAMSLLYSLDIILTED